MVLCGAYIFCVLTSQKKAYLYSYLIEPYDWHDPSFQI